MPSTLEFNSYEFKRAAAKFEKLPKACFPSFSEPKLSLPVSTKAIYVSEEHRVQSGLGWLTIMHSIIQPVFTECFYLPGTALGPGETSVNKTQSLLTVLRPSGG